MSSDLPPQIKNQLAQLQQIQQQAQAIAVQKNQVEINLKETDLALEELEKIDADAVVYRAIGDLMIKTERDRTKESLKEKKDTLDLRMQTLARQEERAQKRFHQLQDQLKQAIGTPAQ
ncbi:MAG: prefoldin subunit beta [Euryarchaeota archaeon]|nr:prefoldin subunit beta [Euryarchaeota archaeon]MBU4340708.1 prefoldin subunit beta [Euryarchaeota archaeon]MBU4454100.1 prefoldin subunit beta [Euryarchaeota archaeon]MCG2735808.1 prefoldin subunit beta [Candidatus Methanoperedenaceae archaeon]MDP3103668.1 prefoldin subunit beta [Candidatus Methanoperedens sp.]